MRDEFIDDLLTSLKIIGSIKEGQKVCVRNGLLILEQNSTGFQASLRRWIHGDNRATTIHYIKNVVHNAIMIAKLSDENQYELLKSLDEVIVGLGRLEVTYSPDIATCSAIQVLCDRIKNEIKKLNHEEDI